MAGCLQEQKRMKWTEFLQQQKRDAVELKEQLDEEYVRRAETLLRGPGFRYGKEARQMAEKVVLEGKRLSANDGDGDGSSTKVNDVGEERKELFDVALLFIKAVVDAHQCSGATPIEQDRINRAQEYYNFMNSIPYVKGETFRFYSEQCEVTSYEMMKREVTKFIKKYGTRAGLVTILFDGHGTKKGELLFREGEQPHKSVFEKDFGDIVEKFRSPKNGNRPQLTQKLIFAQCYAHVPSETDTPTNSKTYKWTNSETDALWYTRTNSKTEVVWFTNEDKTSTSSLGGDHIDLTAYGKSNPLSKKIW